MKKIKLLVTAALVATGLSLFVASCETDKCKDVTCNNGGICLDGTCDCADGFEGTTCDSAAYEKFKGVWTGNETCTGGGTATYSVNIYGSSTAPKKVLLDNLGNYGCSTGGNVIAVATASGKTFTLNSDTTCGTVFSGTGTLGTDGKIVVSYTARYGTTTDVCTVTLSK